MVKKPPRGHPIDCSLNRSTNKKWTIKGVEINLKKAGLEEHSPRKAVEFLMNQMKQYAKRYISMCPAQLRRKKHTEVKNRNTSEIKIWPQIEIWTKTEKLPQIEIWAQIKIWSQNEIWPQSEIRPRIQIWPQIKIWPHIAIWPKIEIRSQIEIWPQNRDRPSILSLLNRSVLFLRTVQFNPHGLRWTVHFVRRASTLDLTAKTDQLSNSLLL